jgi:flagellar biosynthesis/type III secretory pathway M-ring protein FliF/YscJ
VEVLLVIVVLAVAVWIVLAPLRPGRHQALDAEESRRDELEARKEAKYREIRDAEMDFRTGKLSEADWRALDRSLRAEAIEILRALDDQDPDGDVHSPT